MMSSLESLSDERSGLVILTVLLEVSKTDFLNNPQPLNGAESIISPGGKRESNIELSIAQPLSCQAVAYPPSKRCYTYVL